VGFFGDGRAVHGGSLEGGRWELEEFWSSRGPQFGHLSAELLDLFLEDLDLRRE
jgi:hypothetical protein